MDPPPFLFLSVAYLFHFKVHVIFLQVIGLYVTLSSESNSEGVKRTISSTNVCCYMSFEMRIF